MLSIDTKKCVSLLFLQFLFIALFFVSFSIAQPRLLFGNADQDLSQWLTEAQNINRPFLQQQGLLALSEALSVITNNNNLNDLEYVVLVNDHNHTIQDGFGDAVQIVGGQQMIVVQRYRSPVFGLVMVIGEAYGQHIIARESIEEWQQTVMQAGLGNESGELATVSNSGDENNNSPRNTESRTNIPNGKGVFQMRGWDYLGTPEEMAQNFADANLNWIAWYAPMSSERIIRFNEAIRAEVPNLQVYVWLLNHPRTYGYTNSLRLSSQQQVDYMVEKAVEIQANGIILDIEGSFRSRGSVAHDMFLRAREQVREHDIALGITPMGLANVPNYLNREDLQNADFVMPQLYDRRDRLSPQQHRQRSQLWNAVSETVIPLAGAHHCTRLDERGVCIGVRSKTEEEMQEILDNIVVEDSAVGWWSYHFLDDGNRWNVVRDFTIN